MVFLVVTYSCESWTVTKAEHQRIDAFKMWCWRRLPRDPWRAKPWRSNQSILEEVNTEYSLEGLILKLQYFDHLMWKTNLLEKCLMLERLRTEGEEGIRWWDGWMASMMQWAWPWANFRRWWSPGRPGVLQSLGSQKVRPDWVTEQQYT